jgi:acetyl-CoA synthetase
MPWQKKTPDKTALLWLSNTKEEKYFTFADMKRYSNQTANYFVSLGIKKGDRVMLVLKRHYQFWFSMLALHKIGAIAIPATNQLMSKDFSYRIDKAGVKALVCTADGTVADEVDDSLQHCSGLEIKIIANGEKEGWHNFDRDIKTMSDVFERPTGDACPMKDEIMLMYFTSGTTSYPKIAAHSHMYSLGHLVTARFWHNVEPDGIHLTISDTGWGKAAWGKLYGQWRCETCIFVYDFDRFHAHDILPLFARYHITTFCAPPTMFRFFIKENMQDFDLSSLNYATVAGEALNPEVFNRFYEYTGVKLMEGFGQTETTLLVANLIGDEPKPGSMGRRIRSTMSI